MRAKSVVPREQAHRDVEDAIAHYLCEDADAAASGFIDALEKAYGHRAIRQPVHRATLTS
jgi:toxin ParE1/3/4